MLTFDNARKTAQEMHSEAFKYTEIFLQTLFDFIDYSAEMPFERPFCFGTCLSLDCVIDDEVLYLMFQHVLIDVTIDCFSGLKVELVTPDDGLTSELSTIYTNIQEVLLQNNFTQFLPGQFIRTI